MSNTATGVHVDPRRGHIGLTADRGAALVTMVNTGETLALWSHQAAWITPEVALELSEALRKWALPKAIANQVNGT